MQTHCVNYEYYYYTICCKVVVIRVGMVVTWHYAIDG